LDRQSNPDDAAPTGKSAVNQRYLQVTYRNGRPLVAYLYLPRKIGDKSARCVRCDGGLVLDFAADGRPIGVEITAPRSTTLEVLNRALATAQLEPLSAGEIQPLLAAA
jgi:hypothetical protein